MVATFDFQQRFDQLIKMNEQAFQAGLLNLAYHTLFIAFECAFEIKSKELMLRVGDIAQQELAWIDANEADFRHSTQSTARRNGGDSIYKRLSNLATRSIEMTNSIQRMNNLMEK